MLLNCSSGDPEFIRMQRQALDLVIRHRALVSRRKQNNLDRGRNAVSSIVMFIRRIMLQWAIDVFYLFIFFFQVVCTTVPNICYNNNTRRANDMSRGSIIA